MTELSPSAQAVLTAATQKLYCLDPEDVPMSASEYGSAIAAALCAVADEVGWDWEPCSQLLSIADELEGVTYGTYRCNLEDK